MLDVVPLHCQMPLCWSSTLPLNIPSHRAGPLGVAFVGLLLCPRCLQCEHACMVPRELCPSPCVVSPTLMSMLCMVPSGVVLARSLQPSYNTSTTPLGVVFVDAVAGLRTQLVPRELCSLARVHGPSGVVSSSCVVSPHANLKSTSPTTPAQPLGSCVRDPATA